MKKSTKILLCIVIFWAITVAGLYLYLSTMMQREIHRGLEENNQAPNLELIDKQLTITYMGDSLTAGVLSDGSLDPNGGYPQVIRKSLINKDKFASDYNFAVSGYTVEDTMLQLEKNVDLNAVNQELGIEQGTWSQSESLSDIGSDVNPTIREAITQSDIIVLTSGANNILPSLTYNEAGTLDIDQQQLKESINDIHKMKEKLYKEIHEINPDVKIYDVGIYMAYSELDEKLMQKLYPALVFAEGKLFINDEINNIYRVTIRDNIQANLTTYIDNPNNIHPNSLGYAVMGNEILKKISETFS